MRMEKFNSIAYYVFNSLIEIDDKFEDGNLLDYSENELTEEQLNKISNYFLNNK